MVDLGDTIATLSRAWHRGEASGVDVEFDYAQVIDQRDGIVTCERDFSTWH